MKTELSINRQKIESIKSVLDEGYIEIINSKTFSVPKIILWLEEVFSFIDSLGRDYFIVNIDEELESLLYQIKEQFPVVAYTDVLWEHVLPKELLRKVDKYDDYTKKKKSLHADLRAIQLYYIYDLYHSKIMSFTPIFPQLTSFITQSLKMGMLERSSYFNELSEYLQSKTSLTGNDNEPICPLNDIQKGLFMFMVKKLDNGKKAVYSHVWDYLTQVTSDISPEVINKPMIKWINHIDQRHTIDKFRPDIRNFDRLPIYNSLREEFINSYSGEIHTINQNYTPSLRLMDTKKK